MKTSMKELHSFKEISFKEMEKYLLAWKYQFNGGLSKIEFWYSIKLKKKVFYKSIVPKYSYAKCKKNDFFFEELYIFTNFNTFQIYLSQQFNKKTMKKILAPIYNIKLLFI